MACTTKRTVYGVNLTIRDTRVAYEVGPDEGVAWDYEEHGGIYISITAAAPVSLDVMSRVMYAARRYEAVAQMADICQPHPGEQRLQAESIDDLGDVVLRIYRGERRCDAMAVRVMAHLDPRQYSQAGPVAQAAVAWMRDVAIIIRDAEDNRSMKRDILAMETAAK